MDAAEFERWTGRPPKDDDLERVNCPLAGQLMHWCCGWCDEHGTPVFSCVDKRHYRDGRHMPAPLPP